MFYLVGYLSHSNRTVWLDQNLIEFTNMKIGTDSIIVKYDESKCNKVGEKCTNNNIYANPIDPSIYFFTPLGIYCFYEPVLLISRDGILLKENSKLGTAANMRLERNRQLTQKVAQQCLHHEYGKSF